jgi:hypothetical protein
MEITEKMLKRFWSHVEKRGEDECWPWLGGHDKVGYGIFKMSPDRTVRANRFALMSKVGDLPRELFACHTCDAPGCVNPNHLFAGTAKQNFDDMMAKERSSIGRPTKLSDQDVYDIRVAYHVHKEESQEIARRFSITPQYVSVVANEKTCVKVHPLCKNPARHFIGFEHRYGVYACEDHLVDLQQGSTHLIPVDDENIHCEFVIL